jgi:dephospho-CoA kinase
MGAMRGTTGRLLFVTGASGVGKTTTLRLFEQDNPGILVRYFDGFVPRLEEMIEAYGSGEEWQRHKTIEWIGRIKDQALPHASIILDIQTRQIFVDEACDLAGISDYRIVLFDCADGAREQRLIARGHPELANSQMAAWASYLRAQALMRSDPIIDTTILTIEDAANELEAIARRTFGERGARPSGDRVD